MASSAMEAVPSLVVLFWLNRLRLRVPLGTNATPAATSSLTVVFLVCDAETSTTANKSPDAIAANGSAGSCEILWSAKVVSSQQLCLV